MTHQDPVQKLRGELEAANELLRDARVRAEDRLERLDAAERRGLAASNKLIEADLEIKDLRRQLQVAEDVLGEGRGDCDPQKQAGMGDFPEKDLRDRQIAGKEVGTDAGCGAEEPQSPGQPSVGSSLDPVEQFKRLRDELLGEVSARVILERLQQYGWLPGCLTDEADRRTADMRRALAIAWDLATGHAPFSLPADSNLDQGGDAREKGHETVPSTRVAGAAVDVGGGPETSDWKELWVTRPTPVADAENYSVWGPADLPETVPHPVDGEAQRYLPAPQQRTSHVEGEDRSGVEGR